MTRTQSPQSLSAIRALPRRMRRRLRALTGQTFINSEEGTAAIEFGLLAPLIIGLYLALAELSLAMAIDRQVSHSASVAGDLATQAVSVDEEDVADILSATLRVAGVRDEQNMTIRLQSFMKDDKGEITNLGTVTYNPAGADRLDAFDVQTLKPELLSEDSGVVVAQVAYSYSPMGFGKSSMAKLDSLVNMSETFLLKPRRSTEVEIGGKDAKWTCYGSSKSVTCATPPPPSDDDDETNTSGGEGGGGTVTTGGTN